MLEIILPLPEQLLEGVLQSLVGDPHSQWKEKSIYICRIPHLGEIVVAVSFRNRAMGSKGWASRITLEQFLSVSSLYVSNRAPRKSITWSTRADRRSQLPATKKHYTIVFPHLCIALLALSRTRTRRTVWMNRLCDHRDVSIQVKLISCISTMCRIAPVFGLLSSAPQNLPILLSPPRQPP